MCDADFIECEKEKIGLQKKISDYKNYDEISNVLQKLSLIKTIYTKRYTDLIEQQQTMIYDIVHYKQKKSKKIINTSLNDKCLIFTNITTSIERINEFIIFLDHEITKIMRHIQKVYL